MNYKARRKNMFNPLVVDAFKRMFRGFYYTVQEGESLEIISKRYGVNVNFIININNLTYPYTLKMGEKIYISGVNEPISPQRGSIYTVEYGDTVEKIARNYNVTVEELVESNYIPNRIIFVGQKLLIPSKDINENVSDISENVKELYPKEDSIRVYSTDYSTNQSAAAKLLSRKFGILRKGSKGREVQTLQRLLSAIGYNVHKLENSFGTELEKQIIEIQRDAGLEQNGIVDEKTWEYIFSKINKTPVTLK
jgi:LysM repeat protein